MQYASRKWLHSAKRIVSTTESYLTPGWSERITAVKFAYALYFSFGACAGDTMGFGFLKFSWIFDKFLNVPKQLQSTFYTIWLADFNKTKPIFKIFPSVNTKTQLYEYIIFLLCSSSNLFSDAIDLMRVGCWYWILVFYHLDKRNKIFEPYSLVFDFQQKYFELACFFSFIMSFSQ